MVDKPCRQVNTNYPSGHNDVILNDISTNGSSMNNSPSNNALSDHSEGKAKFAKQRLDLLSEERKETKIKANQDVEAVITDIFDYLDPILDSLNSEQLTAVYNFLDLCQYFANLPYEGTTNETLHTLLERLNEFSVYFDSEMKNFNPATKVIFIISPLLRFNIEEEDIVIDKQSAQTPNVDSRDIADVMKKSMKWDQWGEKWIEDQHTLHTQEAKKEEENINKPIPEENPKEELLLCRICEQQIESSKMAQHSVICTRNMLIYSSNHTLQKLVKMLKTVINTIRDSIKQKTYIEAQLNLDELYTGYNAMANILPDLEALLSGNNQYDDVNYQRETMINLSDICYQYSNFSIEEIAHLCANLYDTLRQRLKILETAGPEGMKVSVKPNQKVSKPSIRDFQLVKPISRGAYGRVFLARKIATGDLFAIKTMNKRELTRKNQVQHIQAERRIMSVADNPYVVKFYYSFQSRNHLYLVMEFMNGGDLFSLIQNMGPLDEETVVKYGSEIVLALGYLHDVLHVVHRDLKPDNVLISNTGHIKLTDFGLSQIGIAERHATNRKDSELNETTSVHSNPSKIGSNTSPPNQSSSIQSCEESEAGDDVISLEDNDSESSTTEHSHDIVTSYSSSSLAPVQEDSQASVAAPTFNTYVQFKDKKNGYQSTAANRRTSLYHPDIEGLNTALSGLDSDTSQHAVYTSKKTSKNTKSTEKKYRERYTTRSGGFDLGNPHKKVIDDDLEMVLKEINEAEDDKTLNVPDNNAKDSKTAQKSKKNRNTFLHRREAEHSCVGTPDYMAPELYLGQPSGVAADWWSFGVLLYELIVSVPPFNAPDQATVFDNVYHRRIEWPSVPDEMSPEAYDLINRLLDSDPEKRLGAHSTEEVKEHPFFIGVDWDALNNKLSEAAFVPEVTDETDTSYFVTRHSNSNLSEDLKKSMDLMAHPSESKKNVNKSEDDGNTRTSMKKQRNRAQNLNEDELGDLDLDELENLDVEDIPEGITEQDVSKKEQEQEQEQEQDPYHEDKHEDINVDEDDTSVHHKSKDEDSASYISQGSLSDDTDFSDDEFKDYDFNNVFVLQSKNEEVARMNTRRSREGNRALSTEVLDLDCIPPDIANQFDIAQ